MPTRILSVHGQDYGGLRLVGCDSLRRVGLAGLVELRGVRCQGRHGLASPSEPAQLFVADIAIEVDLEPVSRSDSYADVVDLADLGATVRRIVEGRARLLLETVAVDVVQAVLEQFPRVSRACVRLVRPDPPGLDALEEAVSVDLRRER